MRIEKRTGDETLRPVIGKTSKYNRWPRFIDLNKYATEILDYVDNNAVNQIRKEKVFRVIVAVNKDGDIFTKVVRNDFDTAFDIQSTATTGELIVINEDIDPDDTICKTFGEKVEVDGSFNISNRFSFLPVNLGVGVIQLGTFFTDASSGVYNDATGLSNVLNGQSTWLEIIKYTP